MQGGHCSYADQLDGFKRPAAPFRAMRALRRERRGDPNTGMGRTRVQPIATPRGGNDSGNPHQGHVRTLPAATPSRIDEQVDANLAMT